MLDPPLQPARRVVDRAEQLELRVELRVRGGDVLVLVLAQLPLHSLTDDGGSEAVCAVNKMWKGSRIHAVRLLRTALQRSFEYRELI